MIKQNTPPAGKPLGHSARRGRRSRSGLAPGVLLKSLGDEHLLRVDPAAAFDVSEYHFDVFVLFGDARRAWNGGKEVLGAHAELQVPVGAIEIGHRVPPFRQLVG